MKDRWTHYEDGKANLTIGERSFTGAAVDCFAAFEDIGLKPEQLQQIVSACVEFCKAYKAADAAISFAHINELLDAEEKGLFKKPRFNPGEDVFVIEREADAPVDVCGYVYVAECGEHAIVSATINGSSNIDDIMEDQATTTSFDGHGFLAVFSMRDCFHTYNEAVGQVTKEGGYAEN